MVGSCQTFSACSRVGLFAWPSGYGHGFSAFWLIRSNVYWASLCAEATGGSRLPPTPYKPPSSPHQHHHHQPAAAVRVRGASSSSPRGPGKKRNPPGGASFVSAHSMGEITGFGPQALLHFKSHANRSKIPGGASSRSQAHSSNPNIPVPVPVLRVLVELQSGGQTMTGLSS